MGTKQEEKQTASNLKAFWKSFCHLVDMQEGPNQNKYC